MAEPDLSFQLLAYADIDGWADDDHAAAWMAFRRSCTRIVAGGTHPLADVCRKALSEPDTLDDAAARTFFERHFAPHRVVGVHKGGFLTGYFEPELQGSRVRTDAFTVPVYTRPDDLTLRAPDAERAKFNDTVTGFRNTPAGEAPYWTRAEIEEGALAGRGLELLYLADPVEAFIMHVQGSALIALPDGSHVRLGYAAKNGHPYTSIGRLLVERGEMAKEAMSLDALKAWLRADPERGAALMRENRSFIFFRELGAEESQAGPQGAQGVSLTPGRSLAVDGAIHALGTPIWVTAPDLDVHGARGFRRLMIAQDVGSAIRGPERGDIYWGSGAEAGRVAGLTRHTGRFFVLLPKGRDGAGS